MGGDRAILVQTDVAVEPLAVAKVLAKIVDRRRAPSLVLTGKQAIDGDNNADRPDAGRPSSTGPRRPSPRNWSSKAARPR
jgi:hypothetical protein